MQGVCARWTKPVSLNFNQTNLPEGHSGVWKRNQKLFLILRSAVRQSSKKQTTSQKRLLVHPQKDDAEFIACMLSVYELPYNPERPVVCMDEKALPVKMQGNHCPCVRVTIRKQIRNMSGMVHICFCRTAWRHSSCQRENNVLPLTGQKR